MPYTKAGNEATKRWKKANQEEIKIPVTLFSMGTASGTFTWNGTGGKPVSYSTEIPLFSHYSAMRLYFAQNGLTLHEISFEQVCDQFEMENLAAHNNE